MTKKLLKRRNLFQDYFLVFFDMNQETENVVSGIYKTMSRVYIPALQACKAWGDINPPNPRSEAIIRTYVSKIMLFNDYLASKFFRCSFCLLLHKEVVRYTYQQSCQSGDLR